jgi:hypothetical protein
VDRRLHFHLFPRTSWLLREYQRANEEHGAAVNGPALFEWARKTIVQGRDIPKGMPDRAAVSTAIAAILERQA